jgi:hypothetical protein
MCSHSILDQSIAILRSLRDGSVTMRGATFDKTVQLWIPTGKAESVCLLVRSRFGFGHPCQPFDTAVTIPSGQDVYTLISMDSGCCDSHLARVPFSRGF